MRLNLGCGRDIREGWVNVDRQAFPGVDVVWNLDDTPWPWDDASFERITALDILEHVIDLTAVMDECGRVLKIGGTLHIRGPKAGSYAHRVDPTHRRAFTTESFDYYCRNKARGQRYGYGVRGWALRSVEHQGDNLAFVLRRIA